MAQKKKPFKKIALALSLCLILLWTVLGTGASLAWFTDTDEEVKKLQASADKLKSVIAQIDI